MTLSLDPLRRDVSDDDFPRDVDRYLTPSEARALAGALVHHAGEIEAGRC